MGELKEELIELYEELVDDFFKGLQDNLELKELLKDNYREKLEQYKKACQENWVAKNM
mgnify:CR=1 FL=1